ncbi:uncharacterized protein LOC110984645 isoform X2 [Acanthaster planci]|uniref:Uncharacterized protein LOC110984645 isoform X2 n=1 Tax=Acanthaster planci TaxID=133434 RepID=A0A8B7Z6X2_ACAPL|nr:uncharacterized protein LOC110984645 isoform X2 [Acanthaster planci]
MYLMNQSGVVYNIDTDRYFVFEVRGGLHHRFITGTCDSMGKPTKVSVAATAVKQATKRKATLSTSVDDSPSRGKKTRKTSEESESPSAFEEEIRKREGYTAPLPKRSKKGDLIFADSPDIRPNMTPSEVLQAGSFGGTYFRPIKSGVTGEKYSGVWKELPKEWLQGLNIGKQISSSVYDAEVNTYKVKCGGSLEMWESSGWMHKQDPYGWFQWYCRFYLGRRTDDDARQISRWSRCAGVKGRWRNNLIAKCVRSGCAYDNFAISPVVRQTLQHWGYRLTKEDFDKGAKRVK